MIIVGLSSNIRLLYLKKDNLLYYSKIPKLRKSKKEEILKKGKIITGEFFVKTQKTMNENFYYTNVKLPPNYMSIRF